LRDRLAAVSAVPACCEVSVVQWNESDGVQFEGSFQFRSSLTAPGSFCRLHITVTRGSSLKDPQSNRLSKAGAWAQCCQTYEDDIIEGDVQ